MMVIRLWNESPDKNGWRRSWAAIGTEERGHLLAQLMHGNLMGADECQQLISTAQQAVADQSWEYDAGFGNSVGVYFKQGMAMLDHVVPSYGQFTLPAGELIKVVQAWERVLMSKEPMECQLQIEV
jgi:hypothetical protein